MCRRRLLRMLRQTRNSKLLANTGQIPLPALLLLIEVLCHSAQMFLAFEVCAPRMSPTQVTIPPAVLEAVQTAIVGTIAGTRGWNHLAVHQGNPHDGSQQKLEPKWLRTCKRIKKGYLEAVWPKFFVVGGFPPTFGDPTGHALAHGQGSLAHECTLLARAPSSAACPCRSSRLGLNQV